MTKGYKVLFCIPLLVVALLVQGCKTEKLLSDEFDPSVLYGPIGITIVPGTNLALVTNSNYKLDYRSGSLVVIDLTAGEIVSDATMELPNFSGQVVADDVEGRILIPNRVNNSLVVFDYTVPGEEGLPISFVQSDLSNAIEGLSNQIKMEEDPFGVIRAAPAGITSKILVTNINSGDVSVLLAGDLSLVDADPDDDDSEAIPLMSMGSIGVTTVNDGVGANRMALSIDERLVFATSSSSNYIFVIDTLDNKVEGVIDLTTYASLVPGMRGIVVAADGRLYVAHRYLGGIIVLDVSGVADNGINNEVIPANYITFIPTGAGPEGLAFNIGETKLYASNENESSVSVIDLASLSVTGTIYTERGPTEIAVHAAGRGYVTNFLSDSVTVFDTATDTAIEVIK